MSPEPFLCPGCGVVFPDETLDQVANDLGEPTGLCAECYSRERAEAALAVARQVSLLGGS